MSSFPLSFPFLSFSSFFFRSPSFDPCFARCVARIWIWLEFDLRPPIIGAGGVRIWTFGVSSLLQSATSKAPVLSGGSCCCSCLTMSLTIAHSILPAFRSWQALFRHMSPFFLLASNPFYVAIIGQLTNDHCYRAHTELPSNSWGRSARWWIAYMQRFVYHCFLDPSTY
jgi:hypothetical protein